MGTTDCVHSSPLPPNTPPPSFCCTELFNRRQNTVFLLSVHPISHTLSACSRQQRKGRSVLLLSRLIPKPRRKSAVTASAAADCRAPPHSSSQLSLLFSALGHLSLHLVLFSSFFLQKYSLPCRHASLWSTAHRQINSCCNLHWTEVPILLCRHRRCSCSPFPLRATALYLSSLHWCHCGSVAVGTAL